MFWRPGAAHASRHAVGDAPRVYVPPIPDVQVDVMPPRMPAPPGQNTACATSATETFDDPAGIGSPASGQMTWWRQSGEQLPGHCETTPTKRVGRRKSSRHW